jgi:hypothetical protein
MMGRKDHTLVAKNRAEPAQSSQLLDKPCLQKLKIVVMMQNFLAADLLFDAV